VERIVLTYIARGEDDLGNRESFIVHPDNVIVLHYHMILQSCIIHDRSFRWGDSIRPGFNEPLRIIRGKIG
jgi:hypothetical protein